MSSGSRKARQVIFSRPLCDEDARDVGDSWAPDWGAACCICGAVPCVTGLRAGRLIYESHMCGTCTFNDDACVDPAAW